MDSVGQDSRNGMETRRASNARYLTWHESHKTCQGPISLQKKYWVNIKYKWISDSENIKTFPPNSYYHNLRFLISVLQDK